MSDTDRLLDMIFRGLDGNPRVILEEGQGERPLVVTLDGKMLGVSVCEIEDDE